MGRIEVNSTREQGESFAAGSPSKEYVYAGRRLVATEEPTIQPVFEGYVDGFGCGAFFGWAWDQNQPNSPINLDIYEGNTQIATVTANLYRRDLADIEKGNGFHGFIYTVPSNLKDAQNHSVSVKYSGTATNLGNSPGSISCSNNGPVYQGYHDTTNCTTIGGWAWDSTHPYDPVSVTIYDGSTPIAMVMASQFRQDLLDAGIGNGYHGFSYPYPSSLKDGITHQIYVKYTAAGANLGTTPMAMTCPGPWNGGNHDLADCNTISGWAWDQNQPNGRITVDIIDGDTLLVRVLASQFRQDLLNPDGILPLWT